MAKNIVEGCIMQEGSQYVDFVFNVFTSVTSGELRWLMSEGDQWTHKGIWSELESGSLCRAKGACPAAQCDFVTKKEDFMQHTTYWLYPSTVSEQRLRQLCLKWSELEMMNFEACENINKQTKTFLRTW